MTTDLYLLAYLGIFVMLLTLCTEALYRRSILPQWLSRKMLHVGAVGVCAVAPAWLADLTMLTWIVAFVEPLLFFLVATGRLFTEVSGRRSWGITLFPLAYLVLLLLFPRERGLIVVPMAILALSDAAAAVIGQLFAKKYYTLTGDRKSLLGSVAFIMSVPLVFILMWILFPALFITNDFSNFTFWWGLIGVAILLAILEALGSNGFDNVWIPLGAAFLLQQLFINVNTNQIFAIWLGILVAILFCIYTIRKKALTLDGAVVASLLGLWVVWFAGALWLIPLFFFFITSTLLGRLPKNKAQATDAKHGKARDYLQVLCNGGIYSALATFVNGTERELILTLMLVSISICTSDTWSSEIGIYFRWKTYDILRFKMTPVGLSGGVSLPGTMGGLFGALAMAMLDSILIYNYLNFTFLLVITLGGFIGMLLDSIMGASLQARYQNTQTKMLSDQADESGILQNGWRWMTNDAVNFWSNLLVTAGMGYLFTIVF